MQLLKTLKNPKLFVSDWLSAVSVLLGLPKHYQPIVGVVGAAVVDVGGVGVGSAVVVAFDGGGHPLAVAEGSVDELIGVVALLEFEAFGVGFVFGVPFHLALFIEPPLGEGAHDINPSSDIWPFKW